MDGYVLQVVMGVGLICAAEVIEAEEQRMKERKANHEAEMRTIRESEAKSNSKRESVPEVE
jgi:hypothetical protein